MSVFHPSRGKTETQGSFLEDCWGLASPCQKGTLGNTGSAPPPRPLVFPVFPIVPKRVGDTNTLGFADKTACIPVIPRNAENDECAACSERAYIFDERMGIADGLEVATHYGSPAWLVAVAAAFKENHEALPTASDARHPPIRAHQ